ncbi:hypothetical protein KY284_036357 [Solanum tuberosum]|nr:hypothetical protein KY284_036357 [Solanum tuberosum]
MKAGEMSVTLEIPNREILEWEWVYKPKLAKIISSIWARKMVGQGCWLIWLMFRMLRLSLPLWSLFRWCMSFKEVFPMDLPGMPPYRDINFCIDLETDTRLISIPPYRMALEELREVKAEIQELLDKGFICASVSKWGALVLFDKKKEGSMRTDDFVLIHKGVY